MNKKPKYIVASLNLNPLEFIFNLDGDCCLRQLEAFKWESKKEAELWLKHNGLGQSFVVLSTYIY